MNHSIVLVVLFSELKDVQCQIMVRSPMDGVNASTEISPMPAAREVWTETARLNLQIRVLIR